MVRTNDTDAVADEAARLNDEALRQAKNGPAARQANRKLPEVDEDDRVRIRDGKGRRSSGTGSSSGALIGLGLTLATAGAAAFLFAKAKAADDGPDGPLLSDAPDHVLRGKALKRARNQEDGRSLVGRTVTIGKPAQELYAFWRKFERFPEFMDNVREIKRIDDTRSEWIIEAPGGATVSVKARIVEDVPGKTIAWVSEADSQVEHEGRVEFADAPPGRGTYVRLLLRYTPPAGELGRLIAKVMQREPNVQARRDLRRFKQLMETGEVPVNASPSGRKSEDPSKPHI
ncbi:SRPBCC family protein [Sphingomonas glaciei]|uniref:SRPBCC family protein n=1 Tax=Sphingomonas glaciei TaxID=2938948 RepID=A0ABY5MZA3_9SPHN|nr:SRPBCC family protein [Sphingomonas glaciei]UUR08403.1 SRPBCC family protein [Sphingomonas glaciei]